MSNPKITLAHLAKIAGVSTSTVSRALNDSSQISEQVKQQIRQIAEQQHYHVHLGARNLRLRRSNVVGVVIPIDANDRETLSNPFVLEFIGAVGLELRRVGCNLLLFQQNHIDVQYWRSGLVDGFLQLGHGVDPHMLNTLPVDLPLVVWGPGFSDRRYKTVGIDNWKLSHEATTHLLKLGRRRIGVIVGGFGDQDTESYLRYRGYAEALQHWGIEADPNLVAYTGFDSLSGYHAAQQLLAKAPEMDAIFAAHSDIVALAAIEALRESGRQVPDDVSVVGFDNISLGRHFGMPLTTVSQEVQTSGAAMLVEMLLKQLAGHSIHNVTVAGKLIVRRSCGAVTGTYTRG